MRQVWIVFAVVMTALAIWATQASARTWTSNDGKYKVEAELVAQNDKAVTLKKTDGTIIAVPLARLSQADRDHLAGLRDVKPADLPRIIPGTWVGKLVIDDEKMRRFVMDQGIAADEVDQAIVPFRMFFGIFRSEVTFQPDGTYALDGIVRNEEVQEVGTWKLAVGDGKTPKLAMTARSGADEGGPMVMRGRDEFTTLTSADDESLPIKGIIYTRYDKERSRAERAKFAGTWLVASLHKKGAEEPAGAGTRYTFRDKRVMIDADEGLIAGEYRWHVDATHAPFKIDLVSVKREPPMMVLTGIYRLERDELTLCLVPAGCPCPRGFEPTKPGDFKQIYVCRREAARPE